MNAEARIQMLESQVAELQDVVTQLRIYIMELQLQADTGKPHRYCPKCFRYVPVFATVYMDHPGKAGEVGKCANSLKGWPPR